MSAYNKFNCFVGDLANKKHNLGSDTLKVALTNTAPAASNTVYSTDISATELADGNGYTTGGQALSGVTDTDASGTVTLAASDLTWTATGSVGPFRYAVLYNSTGADGPLIGWWDYGSSITLANSGETFKWQVSGNADDAILTLN